MSSPLTYGIAANAEHADCAAFFLNWVATNETARQINVDVGGSNPAARPIWRSHRSAEGSVTNETLAAGKLVAESNGAMDFIANATGAIFAQGWTPELQKMLGGKQDAAGLLEDVQAEYERELADRSNPTASQLSRVPGRPTVTAATRCRQRCVTVGVSRATAVAGEPSRAGCSCCLRC